ncbi:AAA family ATPase [Streptomyces sp. HPF1205]|uniref:AAA family ATPase n=1 Tax=Streptomyces sp. HPF1205 TaxID=2873262 RepID=UPI001CEC46D7|nr:LuxR family transcriptional regulator [Streptomyces sp. HPF1205]
MDLGPVSRSTAEGLVGRDEEVRLLRSFVGEVADGGGAMVVSGEPGVGKSALLEVAAEAAARAGALVLRFGGVEYLTDLSFAGLARVFEPLRREIDALGPPHRDALLVALGITEGTVPDRLTVYGAALALLRRAALTRPVLLIVDDLQWVDRASAEVLMFAARRLGGSRVGFLGGSPSGYETVVDSANLPRLAVRPLDGKAAAQLVGTRFPMLAARDTQRVLAQAQGNPLALLELPGSIAVSRQAGAGTRADVLPLSRRLQDLYASQVARLPERTRRLLLLAALEGGGDLPVLQACAPGEDVLAVLAPAELAQVVRIENRGLGRLVFRHPLVRATVVSGATSGQRAAAHRVLARALAAEPDRRAWHLAEAAPDPDEEVAALLERSALRIRRRGDAAGSFNALVRAADLSPGPADRSRRLAEAACVGTEVAGELRASARLLVEARRADPDLRGSLPAAVAASHVLLNRDGDVNAAHRLLVRALTTGAGRAGRSGGGDRAILDAVRTLHRTCVCAGRPELWDGFRTAVGHLDVPLPPRVKLLVDVYADPARARPDALGRLDAEIHDLHHEPDPTWIERIGVTALVVDRATGCRAALWRVVGDGRDGGAVASALIALTVLCLDDFLTGQWDECARLTDEGTALAESHGYELMTHQFRMAGALLAGARGEDRTARRLVRDTTAWAAPRGARAVEHLARYASALSALGRGDYEEAYAGASAISPPGVLAPHAQVALWAAMDLVEAAVRTGRTAEARAHAAAMRETGLPGISPRLALVTAGAAAMAAGDDRAGPLFEEALAVPDAERWPFDLARIRLAYSEHLRRARAVKESRVHLDAALDTFRHLGAGPWAARAAEGLRATGRTTAWAGRGPRADPLTAQEHRIAVLAASGLTNRQIGEKLFLSHRTVAAHLYRIYPKLGVSSRVTLGEALTALPPHAARCATGN